MYNISFNFDPVTEEVSNLSVSKIEEVRDDAIVELSDNKLKLSKGVFQLLNITTDDRIMINYWNISPEETFPVIGTPAMFKLDSDSGNRITKSRTVSYRGQQKDILLQYGNRFQLEAFKDFYKMIPIKNIEEIYDSTEDEKNLESIN